MSPSGDGAAGSTALAGRPARKVLAARDVGMEWSTPDDASKYVVQYAKIVGMLDLANASITRGVRFYDCEFIDAIDLTDARVAHDVLFDDCRLNSLRANGLYMAGDLLLRGVTNVGETSLQGARIEGQLRCSGSRLEPSHGDVAFDGRNLSVRDSVLCDADFCSTGQFLLDSARVGRSVDLTDAQVASDKGVAFSSKHIRVGEDLILAGGFQSKGVVRLTHADIRGRLDCRGGLFAELDASLVEAGEILLSDDFTATGMVRLGGARVARGLSFEGSTVSGPDGVAVDASGIECQSLRFGHGFSSNGEIKLISALVATEVNCSGSRLSNPGATALAADGLTCKKLYLNESFQAHGEVRLVNAKIDTELNCSGGRFLDGRVSIRAGGMVCGTAYFNEGGFEATGEIDLTDAAITRELNCNDGSIRKLVAPRLTVGVKFEWCPRDAPKDGVNLSFTKIGLLHDRANSWPKGDKLRLTGCTFQALDQADTSKMTPEERRNWLKQADEYLPDIYLQLVRVYRQNGDNASARKLMLASLRDRRRRGGMSWPERVWGFLLDRLVGYGYAIHRILVGVFAIALTFVFVFWYAQEHQTMRPVSAAAGTTINASRCTSDYPCFMPVTYSYELFIPVVNLRQVNYWLPDAASGWFGKALLAYVWVALISGWFVTMMVAGGVGHLLSQRE